MRTSIRELAKEALSTDQPVDLYVLHEKYRVSPGDAAWAARFFVRVGIARMEGSTVIFAKEAKRWIIGYRAKFFLDGERPWASIDRPRPDPAIPYLPSLANVDREFFLRHVERSSHND